MYTMFTLFTYIATPMSTCNKCTYSYRRRRQQRVTARPLVFKVAFFVPVSARPKGSYHYHLSLIPTIEVRNR